MQSFIGLFWILGGGIVGFVAGMVGGFVIGEVSGPSHRDGASGILAILLGVIGALIGMAIGLGAYGQSAPTGFSTAYLKSGALGFGGFLVCAAFGLGAFLHLREVELRYFDSGVYLDMEVRAANSSLPPDPRPLWFEVEMETSGEWTRSGPRALIDWERVRKENNHTVYPALFSPLLRTSRRKVYVQVGNQQVETFAPRLGRVPALMPAWSEWLRPVTVDPPRGFTASAPLQPMFELRYRVRKYNEDIGVGPAWVDWKRYF